MSGGNYEFSVIDKMLIVSQPGSDPGVSNLDYCALFPGSEDW